MKQNRRTFLQTIGASGVGAALTSVGNATADSKEGKRRFHYV